MNDYTIENQDFFEYNCLVLQINTGEFNLNILKSKIRDIDEKIQGKTWYIGNLKDGEQCGYKMWGNIDFLYRMELIREYNRKELIQNEMIEKMEVSFSKLKDRVFLV